MDWNTWLQELRQLGVYPRIEQRPCGRARRDGRPCRTLRMRVPDYNPDLWEPPACRAHMTADELAAHKAALAKSETIQREQILAEPVACWAWPFTDHDRARSAAAAACTDPDEARKIAWNLLRDWQDGHCAICGYKDQIRVLDHDHATGMVRGWLCRSCNVSEGFAGSDGRYGRYRERNPASMLGIQIQYVNPFTGQAAEPERMATLEEKVAMAAALAERFYGNQHVET